MLKGGEVKRAVECCVALSQWDQAVALAQQYSIPQVQSLLFKYAAMLLDQHKTMEAAQLYRKVNPPASSPLPPPPPPPFFICLPHPTPPPFLKPPLSGPPSLNPPFLTFLPLPLPHLTLPSVPFPLTTHPPTYHTICAVRTVSAVAISAQAGQKCNAECACHAYSSSMCKGMTLHANAKRKRHVMPYGV